MKIENVLDKILDVCLVVCVPVAFYRFGTFIVKQALKEHFPLH